MSPVEGISPLADTSKVAFLESIQFALISFYSQLGMSGHESAVKVSRPRDETDRRGAVPPSHLLTRNTTLAMLRKSTEDKIKAQSSLGSKAGPVFAFAQALEYLLHPDRRLKEQTLFEKVKEALPALRGCPSRCQHR